MTMTKPGVIGRWAAIIFFCAQHDRAIAAFQRALDLNPNDADVINDFGPCLSCAGRAEEGVQMIVKAMRLNPHYPEWWLLGQGQVYFDARRYKDAIATLERLRTLDTIGVQLYLAASRAALGDTSQAREAVARLIGFDEKASIRSCAPGFLDVYKEANDREHLRLNLLRAGLPE